MPCRACCLHRAFAVVAPASAAGPREQHAETPKRPFHPFNSGGQLASHPFVSRTALHHLTRTALRHQHCGGCNAQEKNYVAFDSVPGNQHPIFTFQRKYLVRALLSPANALPGAHQCRGCKAGACTPALVLAACHRLCTSPRVPLYCGQQMSPVPL